MLQGLSIIIVNYKSVNLINDCIHSFLQNGMMNQMEIIIVDNDSQDGSEIALKKSFPFIRYIQMGYNAGFSRANNKGIAAAQFNTVLLLNSDTIIESNAIVRCYEAFINSNYVACGIQLLNYDRTFQISGSYVMKGGFNYLLLLPYTGSVVKLIAAKLKVRKPSINQAIGTQEIDWINGAFMMVKQEAIKFAGMMDEDFFLYMEEIEWCSRLRKQGKLCIFGGIHSVHLQGMTTKDHFKSTGKGYQNLFDKMGQQMMLSIWVRQRKEFGIGWFLFLIIIYGVEIPIFFVSLCFAKIIAHKKYSFQNFKGYTINYFKNLFLFKKLCLNKPFFYKVI